MKKINWKKSKNTWFLSFTCFILRNTHAKTLNGLTWEDDGIMWVGEQFEAWARNQNVSDIPVEVMQEFMDECTDEIGCILRNMEECPICDHKKE